MKNASMNEKKIKKLLSGLRKSKVSAPLEGEAAIAEVIQAILQPDTFTKQAREGYEHLVKDFVDFNELRVSPPKEIIERLGRNFPDAREKADTLILVLNRMFDQTCTMTISYMDKIARKDLRRHMQELGMSLYSASYVLLTVFGQHAIPVDQSLVESLEMEGILEPGAKISDIQTMLEKIVQPGYALSAHALLRSVTEKNLKVLEKRRSVIRAKADAEAAAKAKVEAAAKAKADAAAKVKAEADAAKAKAAEEKRQADEAAAKAQAAAAKKQAKAKAREAARKQQQAHSPKAAHKAAKSVAVKPATKKKVK